MTPGDFASVVLAQKNNAKRPNQLSDNSHYMMDKQVDHQSRPTSAPRTPKSGPPPPQIYSPTSAPLHAKRLPKFSRVPAKAASLPPTQRFEAIMDASVHNTARAYGLTPAEEFDKTLIEDLEAKTRAEANRMARWYSWW